MPAPEPRSTQRLARGAASETCREFGEMPDPEIVDGAWADRLTARRHFFSKVRVDRQPPQRVGRGFGENGMRDVALALARARCRLHSERSAPDFRREQCQGGRRHALDAARACPIVSGRISSSRARISLDRPLQQPVIESVGMASASSRRKASMSLALPFEIDRVFGVDFDLRRGVFGSSRRVPARSRLARRSRRPAAQEFRKLCAAPRR